MVIKPLNVNELRHRTTEDLRSLKELEYHLDITDNKDPDEYRKIKKKIKNLRACYESLDKELVDLQDDENSVLFGVYCEYRMRLGKIYERVDDEIKESKVRALISS